MVREVELLSLIKRDISSLSDAELARLMEETQQESTRRRNKLGGALIRSRWMVSILLLAVAFFILFKAETNGMEEDTVDKPMAAPGDKGAWLMEPDERLDNKKFKDMPPLIKEEEKQEAVVEDDSEETEKKEGEEEEVKEEPAASEPEQTEEETTPKETQEEEAPEAVEETKEEVPETPSTTTTTSSTTTSEVSFKATNEQKIAALEAGTRPKVKYQYKPRSVTDYDDKIKKELADKWGYWTLVDDKASERPKEDFAKDYPNRDIPWDKFPANAWQVDQDYLAKFLPEAKDFVERAMEAMLGEYGWSKFDLPDLDFDERIEGGSFKIETLDLSTQEPNAGKGFVGDRLGGWITQKYFDGLVRRLMHSLLTDDTFTLVMGGHSAAAGHGNHFQQSYTLQFHKVMEPVFARLGLKLLSHNVAYGGLGTMQTSLAAGDLYGKEIDILVWDSSMTEPSQEAYDLYVRQALFAANRIPVLMGGMRDSLKRLDLNIDAEVGMFGTGVDGVPEVKDATKADEVAWAGRYLRCDPELKSFCRSMEYNGTCWIDRDDYTPEVDQQKEPGGRASWHPGFKFHAIKGRIIAFTVLRALYEGLKQWDEAPDKKLPEEVWHVTDHYDNIRTKLEGLHEEEKSCFQIDVLEPKSLCTTPFNGLSEMTPRVNPAENAIRHIMKPAFDGYLPEPLKSAYDPPDVYNPALHVPEGEFDYLAVVENGVDYPEVLAFDNSPLPPFAMESKNKLIPLGVDDIKPGWGWGIDTPANPDECDGSFDGFCGRGGDNKCLLYGHNDHRGGLMFDGMSGWGVFVVPNVKLGVILVRLEYWAKGENGRTDGWEEENNGHEEYGSTRRLVTSDSNSTRTERTRRRLGEPLLMEEQSHRMLGGQDLCEEFQFHLAINGKVTTFSKTEFKDRVQLFQRVVHIQTLLNDESVTNGEMCDVEFAIKMTGCPRSLNTMKLSHIYWA